MQHSTKRSPELTVPVATPRGWVYGFLRQGIMAGELGPGAPLVASQLAASLGASRTPVREALLRLVAEGLAVQTPSGLVVKQLTEEEIMEVYEVRVSLESLAARLAALNVTPLQFAQIQVVHDKLVVAAREQQAEVRWLSAVNLEFHRAVCQAARNKLLLDFLTRIYDSIGRFGSTTFARAGRLAETVEEHEQLVTAIGGRNPERAGEIARRHVQRAMEVRLEMYREGHGQ